MLLTGQFLAPATSVLAKSSLRAAIFRRSTTKANMPQPAERGHKVTNTSIIHRRHLGKAPLRESRTFVRIKRGYLWSKTSAEPDLNHGKLNSNCQAKEVDLRYFPYNRSHPTNNRTQHVYDVRTSNHLYVGVDCHWITKRLQAQ